MTVSGKIVSGYGAASGIRSQEHYPDGTIKMQLPFFKALGLDLSQYFMGTINVDISPRSFEVLKPKYTFENIDWSPYIPSENFFFFDAELIFKNKSYQGLIYLPDPETKMEHHQKPSMLELIMPRLEGIQYGLNVSITIATDQIIIK